MESAFAQSAYQVRFDWEAQGAAAISDEVDVIVVVDVLSFSTSVTESTGVGTYAIVPQADATAAVLANYDVQATNGTLTVTVRFAVASHSVSVMSRIGLPS